MKKIIFSLIITFTLLILSNVKSNGQCPPGWSTKTVSIPYAGCVYQIEICYQCLVTHPGPVYINKIERVVGPCAPSNWGDAIPYLMDYISSAQFVFNELCIWTKPGPCPDNSFTSTFKYYYCFEEYDGPDKVRPCDIEVYCEVTYSYCAKNGLIHRNVVPPSPTPVGGPIPTHEECPEYGWHYPDNCFRVSTPCNP